MTNTVRWYATLRGIQTKGDSVAGAWPALEPEIQQDTHRHFYSTILNQVPHLASRRLSQLQLLSSPLASLPHRQPQVLGVGMTPSTQNKRAPAQNAEMVKGDERPVFLFISLGAMPSNACRRTCAWNLSLNPPCNNILCAILRSPLTLNDACVLAHG